MIMIQISRTELLEFLEKIGVDVNLTKDVKISCTSPSTAKITAGKYMADDAGRIWISTEVEEDYEIEIVEDVTPAHSSLVGVVEVDRLSAMAVCSDVVELLIAKNTDYGDAWQKHGLIGVLVRLSDKALRLQNLSNGLEVLVADESIRDTLQDMLGYAILGLLWEKKNKRRYYNNE